MISKISTSVFLGLLEPTCVVTSVADWMSSVLQNPQPSTSGTSQECSNASGGGRPEHRPLETLSEGHTDEDGGPSPRASIPRGN